MQAVHIRVKNACKLLSVKTDNDLCSEKSVRTKMLIMCAVHIRVKNGCKLISVKKNIDLALF